MAVEAATYTDASGNVVTATVDGVVWTGVNLDVPGEISNQVNAWIDEGNVPGPYVAPPDPAIAALADTNRKATLDRQADQAAARGDFGTAYKLTREIMELG